MPQDRVVPQKPEDTNKAQSGAGHIDLKQVLLPKKPVPGATLDSAQRVNAGALLEQEQKATLPKPHPVEQKSGLPEAGDPRTFAKQGVAKEEPMIPPLQTYKGDIESLIQNTNASAVSIAAAEAARRAQSPLGVEVSSGFDWQKALRRTGMFVAGIAALGAASGMLFFVYQYLNATVPVPEEEAAPFILVDATTPLALPPGDLQRPSLIGTLEEARQKNNLSLGLIGRLTVYETIPQESGEEYMLLGVRELLPVLAPNIPAELLRTLTGNHLLGVHTYDGTQAFILLEVDSYERAFAAMLEWERTIRGDLLPLFNREPRPRLPEEGVATSSVGSVPQVIQTGFADKIVDNRDTRVILNTSGDILLLWAPLTPNLFVITTNEYTLRELISRLGL